MEHPVQFQLWCYYEAADQWKVEGFFYSKESAHGRLEDLRDDVETPNMPNYKIVRVDVVG